MYNRILLNIMKDRSKTFNDFKVSFLRPKIPRYDKTAIKT